MIACLEKHLQPLTSLRAHAVAAAQPPSRLQKRVGLRQIE
jgi:hypothetical protein